MTVVKQSGKSKVRSGQTEEQYQQQLDNFRTTGAKIDTEDGLLKAELSDVDPEIKPDRMRIEYKIQQLYYQRRYKEALELATETLELFKPSGKKSKNEVGELEYVIEQCTKRLGQAGQEGQEGQGSSCGSS